MQCLTRVWGVRPPGRDKVAHLRTWCGVRHARRAQPARRRGGSSSAGCRVRLGPRYLDAIHTLKKPRSRLRSRSAASACTSLAGLGPPAAPSAPRSWWPTAGADAGRPAPVGNLAELGLGVTPTRRLRGSCAATPSRTRRELRRAAASCPRAMSIDHQLRAALGPARPGGASAPALRPPRLVRRRPRRRDGVQRARAPPREVQKVARVRARSSACPRRESSHLLEVVVLDDALVSALRRPPGRAPGGGADLGRPLRLLDAAVRRVAAARAAARGRVGVEPPGRAAARRAGGLTCGLAAGPQAADSSAPSAEHVLFRVKSMAVRSSASTVAAGVP